MITLIKKEILESIRTGKLLILLAVLMLFGLSSPILAKYAPELLKIAMESSQDGMKMQITLPEPKTIDSYIQLFKNIGQIGYIALILLVMGAVSDEKARGTIVLVLTKNVTRVEFLISKFITQILIFTVCYVTAICGFILYTYILFNEVFVKNGILGLLFYWIGGVLLLSLTLLSSTLSKSVTTSAILALGAYAFTGILPILPYIGKYMPSYITTAATELLAGTKSISDFVFSIITTFVCIVGGIVFSIASLNRQEV
jgi:ABC-2 type transport system permease protein